MTKGVAGDIVFLLDATDSMHPAIDFIRENIGKFFQDFLRKLHVLGGDIDWRARVIGYRDVEKDGDDWYVANPFVRDVKSVETHLGALRAIGGGDRPESLLDALYRVVTSGSTPKGAREDDSGLWRHRANTARFVIVFTDAPCHASTTLPEAPGLSWENIANTMMQEGIRPFLVAPQLDCYDDLPMIVNATYIRLPGDSVLSPAGFSAAIGNREVFRKLAYAISKLIWREWFYTPDADTL